MVGYEVLISGIALFMGLHLLAGIYEIRQKLVKTLGLSMYRMIHSIGAVVSLVLIVMGYSDNPNEQLYVVSEWSVKAPIFLMPVALVFLLGSRSTSDIKRITRHPMLWGIVLWSGSHLLANGDKASVMLFGSFFIYGLIAMKLGDDKKSKADPEAWARLKEQTSNIPFAAMISGRVAEARGDHGLSAVIGGLFLYSLLLWMHGFIAGVPLIVA